MQADGGGVQKVSRLDESFCGTPSCAMLGGQERLQVIEIATENLRTLPRQLSGRNSDAVWSPDGKHIAFSSERGS